MTISRYGGCVVFAHEAAYSDAVQHSRRKDIAQEAAARVVWARRLESGSFEIGFELVDEDNFWRLDWARGKRLGRLLPPGKLRQADSGGRLFGLGGGGVNREDPVQVRHFQKGGRFGSWARQTQLAAQPLTGHVNLTSVPNAVESM